MPHIMQTMTVYHILGECTGVIHWHPTKLRELLAKHGVEILLFPKGETLPIQLDDKRVANWLEIPTVSVGKINDPDSHILHNALNCNDTANAVAETVRRFLR